ncbi:hypothetical protein CDEST_15082 [Colletotrichum destructivum]|uniref:Uncharacterized protein n=1 Tax=Colletotrichum destructivum TaxID=34406 RepID=A0AAX4J3T5_9PEZI|nr:hypothetical protein CDEST_15082 [Colletotrichum destructivum]
MCVTRVARHICAHTTTENGHCAESRKRGGRLCKKPKKKKVDVLDYCDWDSPLGYCLYRNWRRGWACHKCKQPTQRSPRCICGHAVCRRCSCLKSQPPKKKKKHYNAIKNIKWTQKGKSVPQKKHHDPQSLPRVPVFNLFVGDWV